LTLVAKRFFCVCAGLLCLALAYLATPASAEVSGYVYVTQWGSYGAGNGQFYYPGAVATDAAGNVYVADSWNHRIQKFTSTGSYATRWGLTGGGNGQFAYPYGLATDAAGNVYVADQYNHRIQVFGRDVTPTASVTWGGVKARYRPDGKARPQSQDR
jgi:DNA-binding beta-propeller fold protein YncE